MRNQRRSGVTVVLVKSKSTEDELGDGALHPLNEPVRGCQFDPDQSEERPGEDQAKVLRSGILNIPGVHQLVADDTVKFYGSTWQVIGDGNVWLDRTKIRVKQTRRR